MPCIAHATKIWTVFDASSIANVLHLFCWFFYTTVCDNCITHILLSWTVYVLFPNVKSSFEWTVCRISLTPSFGWPFLLLSLIANSSSERTVCRTSHTHWYGCPFLLFCLIANSSNGLIVCPASHTSLKSEPCLMHPPSQTFCTFFDGFFYTTVCNYGIAHSFIEGSLIVVSR